jgi:tail-anchored protein insertion receptor
MTDEMAQMLDTRLGSSKAAFSSRFNWLLWGATTGARFVLVWWYRRQPVFYLPPGWLGPFAWFFSLPSAPNGE